MKNKIGIDQEKTDDYIKRINLKKNYENKSLIEEIYNYSLELMIHETGIFSSLEVDVISCLRSGNYYKSKNSNINIVNVCNLLKFVCDTLKTICYYSDLCSDCDTITNEVVNNILLTLKGVGLIEEEIFDFFTKFEIIADCKNDSVICNDECEFKNNGQTFNELFELIEAIKEEIANVKRFIFEARIEQVKELIRKLFKKGK